MQLNCERTFDDGENKKKRKKGLAAKEIHEPTTSVTITIHDENGPVELKGSSWERLSLSKMISFETSTTNVQMKVLVNPPSIQDCGIHSHIIADHPVVVKTDLEHATVHDLCIDWSHTSDIHTKIGNGHVFIPQKSSIGKKLFAQMRMKVDHDSSGEKSCDTAAVQPYTHSWRDSRMELFNANLEGLNKENVLRVASFNILAPVFARTTVAIKDMYPYCAGKEWLSQFRRVTMIGREILELNASILGLQEVSQHWHSTYLSQLLDFMGYSTCLALKASNSMEGCSLSLKKDKFEDIQFFTVDFRHEFLTNPKASFIRRTIANKWPFFFDDILHQMSTVFQFATAICKITHRPLIASNSHLYFHPEAGAIRAIQIWCIQSKIVELRKELVHKYQLSSLNDVDVIMIGDLNSSAVAESTKLLFGNDIESTSDIWTSGKNFKWGKLGTSNESSSPIDDECMEDVEKQEEEGEKIEDNDEIEVDFEESFSLEQLLEEEPPVEHGSRCKFGKRLKKHLTKEIILRFENENAIGVDSDPNVDGLKLTPLMKFSDAYNDLNSELKWTTKVAVFEGRLDWILRNENSKLKPLRVLEGVSDEILGAVGGIPCEVYASDHLSVAADFIL